MSGTEVLACVTAVTSAFQTSVEALDVVKQRKERKKWKREKDLEELVEIRWLHKSLSEGVTLCRTYCEANHQMYGPAFDVGDGLATSQLKDVVIFLQTEVNQALQIAKAVENAIVDFHRLDESAKEGRRNAILAMDQLCQRLTNNAPPINGYYGQESYKIRSPISPVHSGTYSYLQRADSHMSSASSRASSSGYYGNVTIADQTRTQQNSFHRMQSLRQADSSVRRIMSPAAQTASHDWSGPRPRRDYSELITHGPSIQEKAEHEVAKSAGHGQVELDRISQLSLRDSAVGSETTSKHTKAPSINSLAHSDQQRASSVSDYSTSTNEAVTSSSAKQRTLENDDLSPESSETSSISSRTRPGLPSATINFRLESVDDEARAMYAPELVTRGFESMLSQNSVRPIAYPKSSNQSANVHPALRIPEDHENVDSPPSPEPDHVWLPLPRPAKHNNYHGFCKGAWQTRKAVQEGLSIRLIPNSEKKNVPHWTCKLCQFGSKALNSNTLPDQVYFNSKCGVRYRWLFLAKSHVPAMGSRTKPDEYAYGCVFCAAEGRTTAIYERLDKLMVHILGKHNTTMMTVETKEKTKCIIGGVADRSLDWDINLPETKVKNAGGVVGEFVMSAVTGLSKYG